MSGVLHPVGPEPARTYWLRRILVLLILALVVTLVVALVNAVGGDRQSAVPAPAGSPGKPAGSQSPTARTTASPKPSASAGAGSSSTASRPADSASTTPSTAPRRACASSALRTTLRGDQSLKAGQRTTFSVSLINGGPSTCVLTVTPKTFELNVYSGVDRIWTTKHCARLVRTITETVRSEAAVEWRVAWNGRRSAAGCRTGSANPRPGTYVASAQLAGARPVQLRMVIRA